MQEIYNRTGELIMAFQNFYLTDKGADLLAKAQIGQALTYTRAVIGDGVLGSLQPTALIDVINKVSELNIYDLDFSTPNIASVQIQFTNKNVQASFFWREIGLFAKSTDGTEVLYAYGNAGDKADYIPSYGTSPTEFVFLMNTAIGNAAKVDAVISTDIVFATKQDIIGIENGNIIAAKAASAENAATATNATNAITAAGYTSDGDIAKEFKAQSEALAALAGTGRTAETVKGNADMIAAHTADNLFQTAGGTATAITLIIQSTLVDGYPITFIASAANGGVATTINSKPLYKPNTTTAPILIAGQNYTAWYNAKNACFYLASSGAVDSSTNVLWDALNLTLVSGTRTADSLCWLGQNVQYTQPSTNMALVIVASVTYNFLRYGQYSVGFRLKCSNVTSASAVTTLKVISASGTTVASLAVLGTDFADVGANAYKYIYFPFKNSGQSTGNSFTFAITSEAVASTTVAIDSIIVSPMQLANFG